MNTDLGGALMLDDVGGVGGVGHRVSEARPASSALPEVAGHLPGHIVPIVAP
ncbi:hypothetical protein HN371_19275 [Candidatus Poribacteria bacterium]|jgi:hypothetical protein|nr:hypothetical protein [Candidatus Poribacteria bacterium]MBT5534400.1 hypothetical protein [Candidatus Poribacteria bacterium]MBT5709698.1 hypothetical protein [Candidatus Poribacteria bacterium]MBT7097037.1 hypothetical protein [Candidatus Poribacteria bacterium]MBT7804329.1 hypothetical protein [Candidatus Poribacteria bacterium]